ncbi:MAG TPA: hypothetical protein VMT78_11215 [Terriglobia bacterium]|nr:hypothetical protein [Terriglobia bacterium]HVQ65097.1 hypothetical protein [Terriglobia bacterium]
MMGPKTQLLIETLAELTSLLRAHGEVHWAVWIESDLLRIRTGDFYGVTHFLSAYGGSGSFNEVAIHPSESHRADGAEIDRINAQLSNLRSRAWTLAQDISREAVIE